MNGPKSLFLSYDPSTLKIVTPSLLMESRMNQEVPAARVLPRCANAHNCLGPTRGGEQTLKFGFEITYRQLRINDHDETWKCDRIQVAECQLALPCPALQWHQCDSECIFVTLEIDLTTMFSEIFCFGDFFGGRDGTGRDGQTNKQTDKQTQGQTDFSRKILFQI